MLPIWIAGRRALSRRSARRRSPNSSPLRCMSRAHCGVGRPHLSSAATLCTDDRVRPRARRLRFDLRHLPIFRRCLVVNRRSNEGTMPLPSGMDSTAPYNTTRARPCPITAGSDPGQKEAFCSGSRVHQPRKLGPNNPGKLICVNVLESSTSISQSIPLEKIRVLNWKKLINFL